MCGHHIVKWYLCSFLFHEITEHVLAVYETLRCPVFAKLECYAILTIIHTTEPMGYIIGTECL